VLISVCAGAPLTAGAGDGCVWQGGMGAALLTQPHNIVKVILTFKSSIYF